MLAQPLPVHGDVKDVSHSDVVRRLDDPFGIQNRPFEQFQLCGKPPKALTDQNWPLVDINESRAVFIHAQWRFEWALKPQAARQQDVLKLNRPGFPRHLFAFK